MDEQVVLDADDVLESGGLLESGLKGNLTVAQISEVLGVRPQIVNGWVKQGCPTTQEKPRMLNLDDVMEWRHKMNKVKDENTQERTERLRKAKEARATLAGPDDPESQETRALEKLRMTQKDRNLFAWSRGEGRGWALAKPVDARQPVIDDYIDIINHAGKIVPTAGARLLQEAREGTLFVIDVDMAVGFLTGQIEGVINSSTTPNADLVEAHGHMVQAFQHILEWKKASNSYE